MIDASYRSGVKRLLFLGSSCIYPKLAPQPIKEEYLLTGPLEPTNRAYALAKIAGIEMCWSYNRQYGTQYLAAMPTNLVRARRQFRSEGIARAARLDAKGRGGKARRRERNWSYGARVKPRREFLYSDDLAEACVHLLNLPENLYESLISQDEAPLINIGTGEDLTIRELAELVARVLEFECELIFDTTRQDGTPQKLLDVSRIQCPRMEGED